MCCEWVYIFTSLFSSPRVTFLLPGRGCKNKLLHFIMIFKKVKYINSINHRRSTLHLHLKRSIFMIHFALLSQQAHLSDIHAWPGPKERRDGAYLKYDELCGPLLFIPLPRIYVRFQINLFGNLMPSHPLPPPPATLTRMGDWPLRPSPLCGPVLSK